jgi:undecaprenyl-diphosphatase
MPLLPPYPDRYRDLLKPLLVGLAAVLLVSAFAQLAAEIAEGDTRAFDMEVVHIAQSLRTGHRWLAEIMRDLSGLGSTTVLTLVTVIAAGYLALVAARTRGLLVAASVVSGSVLVGLFKAAFGRPRPDASFAELVAPGLSFPSGHASMSAIVFLTIGAITASTRSRPSERAYIMATAFVMTLLVGFSRVALGVHWATDVLGGWAFGAGWAMAWLLLARRLAAHRDHAEKPGSDRQPA